MFVPDTFLMFEFKFNSNFGSVTNFFWGVLILNQRGYKGGKIGENNIRGRIK